MPRANVAPVSDCQLPKCRCNLEKKEESVDWCPFGDDIQEEDNSIKVDPVAQPSVACVQF